MNADVFEPWQAEQVRSEESLDSESWLSIVTVVKDDIEGLERTRRSLLHQDLSGTEWLVVDSSDQTELVRDMVAATAHPRASYLWIPPEGVYPAMNEGLRLANGAYVHFLNAGDEYAASSTVSGLRSVLVDHNIVWLYGQVAFIESSGRVVVPHPFDYGAEKASCFSRGRFPPHQGTVVKTAVLQDIGGFDVDYRIVADYATFLRLSEIADPVEVDDLIARFYTGGISSQRWRHSIAEFHRARKEILKPEGMAAARESVETARQYVKISASRFSNKILAAFGER